MKINGKTKGIICIIAAAFGFSLMSVFVRLAGDLPSFQKAFFRNFIALIFMTGTLLKKKTGFLPRKENALYLVGRSLFGTIGIVCNFYAIDRLVLADANMLNKLSPFFAIIFSALLLKEKPDIVQLCSSRRRICGNGYDSKAGIYRNVFFSCGSRNTRRCRRRNCIYICQKARMQRRGQHQNYILVFCVFHCGMSGIYADTRKF